MEERKKDHIEQAFESQLLKGEIDTRFFYEPMLNPHPKELSPVQFLGKDFNVPLWVSSMTGGTKLAYKINSNLARVCKEFGFGMGLGSCRSLLDSDNNLRDFNMREIIGDGQALYANLGIGQIERLVHNNQIDKIKRLIGKLSADGLIIHVNPLQEMFQPEGDEINKPPIETVKRVLEKLDIKIIVKEVGQGMGPKSLQQLLQLPLEAIEFAAFGGTNFAKLELQRAGKQQHNLFEPLAKVGVDAYTMVDLVNTISENNQIKCKSIIISGGVKNYLDGYYLVSKSKLPAIYGQASSFLRYAKEGYDELHAYVHSQIHGFKLAKNYLSIRT